MNNDQPKPIKKQAKSPLDTPVYDAVVYPFIHGKCEAMQSLIESSGTKSRLTNLLKVPGMALDTVENYYKKKAEVENLAREGKDVSAINVGAYAVSNTIAQNGFDVVAANVVNKAVGGSALTNPGLLAVEFVGTMANHGSEALEKHFEDYDPNDPIQVELYNQSIEARGLLNTIGLFSTAKEFISDVVATKVSTLGSLVNSSREKSGRNIPAAETRRTDSSRSAIASTSTSSSAVSMPQSTNPRKQQLLAQGMFSARTTARANMPGGEDTARSLVSSRERLARP